MGAGQQKHKQSIIAIVLAALVILVTLISLVTAAEASSLDFTNLEVRGEKCFADGRLTFTAENKLHTPLPLKDILINGKHKDTGEEFTINSGSWDQETIHSASTVTKKSVFTSDVGLLNHTGRYLFNASYVGCKNKPCNEHFDVGDCPGYEYSCDVQKQTVKLTKCAKAGKRMYVYFEGFNTDQFEQVDVNSELLLYVESNGRRESRLLFIDGKELKLQKGTEDGYIYSFPAQETEIFHKIGLSSLQCDKGLGSDVEIYWCPGLDKDEPSQLEVEDETSEEESPEQEEEQTQGTSTTPSEQPAQTQPTTNQPVGNTAEPVKEKFFTSTVIGLIVAFWVVLVAVLIIVFVKLND